MPIISWLSTCWKPFNSHSNSKWGLWATLVLVWQLTAVEQTTIDGPVYQFPIGLLWFRLWSELYQWTCALVVPSLEQSSNIISAKALRFRNKIPSITYNKDNLDGRSYWGVTNDYLGLGAWGFAGKSMLKNKDHVRNINMWTYTIACGSNLNNDIDAMQNKINALQKELDDLKRTWANWYEYAARLLILSLIPEKTDYWPRKQTCSSWLAPVVLSPGSGYRQWWWWCAR